MPKQQAGPELLKNLKNAKFGAAAFQPSEGPLPTVFPREMGPNAHKYVAEVIDGGLQSSVVERMEEMLAKAHGVKYCVGAPGCTQALFATMMAMDFEPGDEIIVSPITDYGTVAGALLENYIPVFADSEPDTGLLSAETIAPCITERTRALLVVHKFGLTPDMDPIIALAKKHKLVLIEDVCQAILATYKGRLAGTMGDASCFSFDSEKTCGADVGGATLTNDQGIYDRLVNRGPSRGAKTVPGFGRAHIFRGFPTRIPQCSAATVMANFEILPRQVQQRRKMAALLDSMLGEIPGIIPYKVPKDRTHTYWMYGFSLDLDQFRCTLDEFGEQLQAGGIPGAGSARYYLMPEALWFLKDWVAKRRYPFCTPPASRIPTYGADSTPNARAFLDRWIRWFWTEKYTERHIETIAQIIRQVVERNRR